MINALSLALTLALPLALPLTLTLALPLTLTLALTLALPLTLALTLTLPLSLPLSWHSSSPSQTSSVRLRRIYRLEQARDAPFTEDSHIWISGQFLENVTHTWWSSYERNA